MFDQIPGVAVRIRKDGDGAVNLMARCLQKADAGKQHGRMIANEIVGLEEEADPAPGLIADCGALFIVCGLGKKQGCAIAARRLDDNPALVFRLQLVLQACKAEVSQ